MRHLPLQPLERLNDWLNVEYPSTSPEGWAADLVLPSKLLGILQVVVPLSLPPRQVAN